MDGSDMDEQASQHWQSSQMAPPRSAVGPLPQRRNDESWVEISSQPSSSSLSSIGDEIVTTGLRVSSPVAVRRRRLQHAQRGHPFRQPAMVPQGGTSSQEEYEASESEEDRPLASSSENVRSAQQMSFHPVEAPNTESDEDEDDDDENATALGVANDTAFRPQPNVFSNPPAHLSQRSHSTGSAVPAHPHSGFGRPPHSRQAQARFSRGQPNFMSPSYQADNDAALRASLTTLLSCAAAARGLPKSKDETEAQRSSPTNAGVGPSSQPVELRLVPESELMAEDPPPTAAVRSASTPSSRPRTSTTSSTNSAKAVALPATEKGKRGASALPRAPRASKKKRTLVSDDMTISPTLMMWVVGAGVVVLVSVVGFGAGYVIGRDVGRQEALSASVGMNTTDSASCGREMMRASGGGLRRFRWGYICGEEYCGIELIPRR